MDSTGALNVDEQLRIQGCSNIYSAGGAINLKSRKHFENSKLQAVTVASNIKASALNQEVLNTFTAGNGADLLKLNTLS